MPPVQAEPLFFTIPPALPAQAWRAGIHRDMRARGLPKRRRRGT
jgi:hypothetical protein